MAPRLALPLSVKCPRFVVWVRLTGVTPFSLGPGSLPLHRQICFALRPDFKLLFPEYVSPAARDLLSKLITSAAGRLTAEQALAHPWLRADKKAKADGIDAAWRLERLPTYCPAEGMGFSCRAAQAKPEDAAPAPAARGGAGVSDDDDDDDDDCDDDDLDDDDSGTATKSTVPATLAASLPGRPSSPARFRKAGAPNISRPLAAEERPSTPSRYMKRARQ